MRAITLEGFGGISALQYNELPIPIIKEGEVLIKVKAISINPADLNTRSGKGLYGRIKDDAPVIIGWDIAGIIETVGAGGGNFKEGDAVFGMVNFPGHGRAYAEYVAAPAAHLALKPANISFEEAAAATLAPLTAWQLFTDHAGIRTGDRVLVHAAAGGVGHFAVQLAKHLGAYVIATSSAVNRDFVLGLGADEHIDYKSRPFEEATGDIDLVLDSVGGENIDRSLKVVKAGGSIITIHGGLQQEVVEKGKALGIPVYFILVQSNGAHQAKIAGLLGSGELRSHVSNVFAFEEMGKAHLQVSSGRTVGKTVVVI